MKNWLIGTGIVIGGGLLAIVLVICGLSNKAAAVIATAVSTCGFIIQMYAAFSMKVSFERQSRLVRQEHEALMDRARKLSPEEAIRLLLRNIK